MKTPRTAAETPRLIAVANAAPLPFRQRAVVIGGVVTTLNDYARNNESTAHHNR